MYSNILKIFSFIADEKLENMPPFFDEIKEEVARLIRNKFVYHTKDFTPEQTVHSLFCFAGWYVMSLISHHIKIFYVLDCQELAKGYLQHIKDLIKDLEQTIEKEGTNV